MLKKSPVSNIHTKKEEEGKTLTLRFFMKVCNSNSFYVVKKKTNIIKNFT